MGWTMTLKDDFGVIAWKRRAGYYLSLFVLLSLFSFSVQSDIVFPKDHHFSWKAGQWGQCIGEDCGSGGVQTRTIWCVHMEGWTTHHTHCQFMDKPESQRHCFKVCNWHQDLFEWEVSDWGACVLVPFFANKLTLSTAECITAQHGIQRRKVHCVRTSNRTTVASRICEFFSQKPPVEQACLIPCPQDCVVSDFTSWSSCSKSCGTALQHRTRHVLATPMYGGANCPNLTETRTCSSPVDCPAGEGEYQYSLKVGAWSECRLPHHKDALLSGRTTVDFSTSASENNTVTLHTQAPHHQHHHHHHQHHHHQHHHPHEPNNYPMSWELEMGYQTRQVRCTRSDGKNAMLSLCTKGNSPLTFQACVMPKDCQTSDWSTWSPCSKTCRSTDLSPGYRLRSRIMTQIPVGGGKRCSALEEKEACNIIGDLLPNCPRYVWRTTDWRECHILPLLSQQERRLANIMSRPVNVRLCAGEEPPSAIQNCSIPCQHHCLLSQWSSWGACLHDNCKEPQGKRGFRQRRREVLWESSIPPETCPHLVESVPCEDPVCYQWKVQQEERCIPTESPCGPGTAVQNVTCVSAEENTQGNSQNYSGVDEIEDWLSAQGHFGAQPGENVPITFCEADQPPTEVACEVSCSADCVVGSWSSWSPCSHSCATKNAEGRQSRTRTVLALPGKGGKACPAAPALEEWRVCNDHPCMVFYWEASPWGPCIEDASMDLNGTTFSNGSPSCAVGVQIRKVNCVKMNVGPVISKRCSDSARPETVRPCLLPCKKDCIVTPFSEWTACPSTCMPGLSCIEESGEAANMTECLRWAGPLPPQIRECRVACKDDCTLTAWSKFSECTGCGSSRSRKRSLTGRSKKKDHCLNEKLYPLEETETCPCDEFLSQPYGNWSGCILPDPSAPGSLKGWMSHREVKECGQGLRYRAVACIDQQGHLVNPTLCTDSGYTVEVCHIPCPLDCKLSDWSAWSACSASCGSGLKIRSKWLREKAFNGGRPCPRLDLKNQVYEAVRCHSECSQYEWKIEPWSICTINTVDDLPACGEGVQSRKIRCVKKGTTSGEASSVEDSLCDQEEMPARAQVCFLACANDCVTAPWGPWSNCPPQCDHGTARNRSRHILRLPASENAACPELVQSEPCVLNSTCFTYQYRVSDWSTCQLRENAICGQGSRLRLLDCIRSDGKIVELKKCEQFGLINKWGLSESCVVDCPVSCILSDWSSWADCSHTCGSQGQSVRTRRILQEAHEEGRPCPNQLTQTKPCPIRPCYTWQLSDWSYLCVCVFVQGAECGEGLRRRNLSCVVHWGDWPESPAQPVEEELCGDKLRQQIQQDMKQPCFIPCPGDCHLTVWSSWSSCQLTCLEGRSFETTGRQARSRAVIIQVMENQGSCPHQVFETQPCKGGKCHTYQWRTGGWSNNERVVWCQRSDGVNVTGIRTRCFFSLQGGVSHRKGRPRSDTAILRARNPSHTAHRGVCGCEKGYTEVMTTHGFLDYCTRTPGVDNNKKADVKTNSGRLKPGPSQAQDLFNEWTLRPVGPDGRIKLWVYAVTAVGFILILFIIALSFLVCKPSKTTKTSPPPQKPLTLAYDGDMDM
ncbi:Thrombospondin type-1 domain-containing protein 7B [Nibea albiflora]|uniref:Thrombospondin type-1 domain-containing protein 7B n=1 Tax=Nibea albiflora TaxID=240163 RepID=A0ACB7EG89_NIBAL|nr:Thrombospondin type-1 domain-containing protein 7B [Nibea albiflora]